MFTIVDRFLKYIIFLPCNTNSTAIDLALLFFDNIVCKFGIPAKIVSNKDSRFFSNFWLISNEIFVMQGGLFFRDTTNRPMVSLNISNTLLNSS